MHLCQLAPQYLHWGWVQISVANLIVIALMIVIFVCAVAFRMPADHEHTERKEPSHDDD
jgi:hypothetical protein